MKKTPWFSYRQKPRRIGFYECEWRDGPIRSDASDGRWFNWWDGENWLAGYRSLRHAPIEDDFIKTRGATYRLARWRGIECKDRP